MAVTFSDLHTEAGLKSLESFLSGKTYISGNQITKDDVKVYAAVSEKPSADLYPSASKWYDCVAGKLSSSTGSSQALLDLETTTHTSSSKESALLVCKPDADGDLLKKIEAAKSKANAVPVTKPAITAPPPSLVMGKLKDFLGVMAESNKKLQQEAMNSKNLDIEALTGDESEYIEMDLMLGVADLNTPEAVAAAESAIVGSQPIISLDASSSEPESEDSYDDDSCSDETDKASGSSMKSNGQTLGDKSTNAVSENGQKRKRSKIVELP